MLWFGKHPTSQSSTLSLIFTKSFIISLPLSSSFLSSLIHFSFFIYLFFFLSSYDLYSFIFTIYSFSPLFTSFYFQFISFFFSHTYSHSIHGCRLTLLHTRFSIHFLTFITPLCRCLFLSTNSSVTLPPFSKAMKLPRWEEEAVLPWNSFFGSNIQSYLIT